MSHGASPKGEELGFKEISASALKKWRLVLVCALGLMLLGTMAWINLPRLEDPKVEAPEMFVSMLYPGASPKEVESQVVRPIEDVLYAMEGVEYVESSALPNAATFHVKFGWDTPVDLALERVRGKVASAKKDLPAEVKDAEVVKGSSALVPQMVIAVVGNRADAALTAAAKKVKQTISVVPGVAGVDSIGEQTPAIRVRLDAVKLANHKLSLDDIAQRLKTASVRVPGGELKVGPLLTLLQVDKDLADAESVTRVVVGASADEHGDTQVVTLGDVADVREVPLALKHRFMVDGMPAVGLAVRFRQSEDAVALGQHVRKQLSELDPRTYPEGISLRYVHDQPSWIKKSVGSFVESLGEGMLLVMIIITLGMGWRAAIVVAGVLPLAAAGALFAIFECGLALDQMSIAGLIIALGLLVDDAIVVTESVQIMRDKGLSPYRSAVYGTARVFWANNGTTGVATASFLPLLLMGGATGSYIKGVPVSVIVALVTSLFVAQLFTPWVASLVLRPAHEAGPDGVKKPPAAIPDTVPFDRNRDSAVSHAEHNPVLRIMRTVYGMLVPAIVRFPWLFVVFFTVLLVGSAVLLPKVGIQFFPKAEKPLMFVTVSLPRGSDIERTNEKLVETVSLIRKDPDVLETSAVAGGGYPAIFLGRAPHRVAKDFADVMVRLKPEAKGDIVARRLRKVLGDVVGANCNVEELYYGPPVTHPVLIRVYGDDYDKLRTYADEVKTQLRTIPGAINVADSISESVPLSRISVDSNKAYRLGVTAAQVGLTVRHLYGNDKVIEFRRGDEMVQVVFETAGSNEADPLKYLSDTPIPNRPGATVPLREVGDARLAYDPAELKSRNTRRVVDVSADVDEKTLPSAVVGQIDGWLKKKKWDTGYGYVYGGAEEETAKSFQMLGIAGAGGLILIFALLVLMFDSIRLSVVVMVAVPYALIGAVFGLFITRNHFGFMSFLGLIALIGVYVNHKIYFIDRYQEFVERGAPLQAAIKLAGQDRLRPVVLTALTAILGLVPLTLEGGAMWGPFGWVSIFGLLTSIPLSLILLPSLIVIVATKKKVLDPATKAALAANRTMKMDEAALARWRRP